MILNNNFSLNTWYVITIKIDNTNSSLRINFNNSIGAIGNLLARDGITLASSTTGVSNTNSEFAYIIMRNVADSTSVQNNFINWLKNRFAI
jgi:hypothetical protein